MDKDSFSLIVLFNAFGYLRWAQRKPFARWLKKMLATGAINGGVIVLEEQIQMCDPMHNGEVSTEAVFETIKDDNPGYVKPTIYEIISYLQDAKLHIAKFNVKYTNVVDPDSIGGKGKVAIALGEWIIYGSSFQQQGYPINQNEKLNEKLKSYKEQRVKEQIDLKFESLVGSNEQRLQSTSIQTVQVSSTLNRQSKRIKKSKKEKADK